MLGHVVQPDSATYEPLLEFWFGKLGQGVAHPEVRNRWFQPDSTFDNLCRTQFKHLVDSVDAGALESWRFSGKGCLAYILVCDQLPRNIYRGNKLAYGWDERALAAATQGVRQGLDQELGWDERAFFYMPFEHSESLLDQHTAVGLFTNLRDESAPPVRQLMGNSLRYAQQHRDIIKRFRRFPHRNAVLGRTSTAEEEAFIEQGDGFGQNPR